MVRGKKMNDIGITHQFCPKCQQQFIRVPHTGDFQHECFGNDTLANEDVLVIGKWADYTGSDPNVVLALSVAGVDNTLQGARAGIEGAWNYDRTTRGFRSKTYRTRKHVESIPDSAFAGKELTQTEPEFSEKL